VLKCKSILQETAVALRTKYLNFLYTFVSNFKRLFHFINEISNLISYRNAQRCLKSGQQINFACSNLHGMVICAPFVSIFHKETMKKVRLNRNCWDAAVHCFCLSGRYLSHERTCSK